MKEQKDGIEVLPLGRTAMRIVNQRAQALSHAVFTQLREELRLVACDAIASGQDVHATLAALRLHSISLMGDVPTPPVGTPFAGTHGGNSSPARALVAGRGKSERCGEPWGSK